MTEEANAPIMLEIATAGDTHDMWERRWQAMRRIYAIERCFADRDGKYGLRDVLEYMGEACGWDRIVQP